MADRVSTGAAAHRIRRGWHLVRDAARRFRAHRGAGLSAATAFYTLLAVAPLLIVAFAVVGTVFGREAERRALARSVGEVMGYEPEGLINEWLLQASRAPGLASTVGIAITILMATRLFTQLEEAMNELWGRAPAEPMGLRARVAHFLRRRLMAFGMVLGAGLVLLALVTARGITHSVGHELFEDRQWTVLTAGLAQTAIAVVVTAMVAAFLYRVLPDASVPWRSAWAGAWFASILFNAAIWLFGWYVGWIASGQSFGAAGALVFLLVWLYYSAQVFLLGASISRSHAESRSAAP